MSRYVLNFLLILGAGLASAGLGGGFAAAIACMSPEFIQTLFASREHPVRFAAALGMIWGLFIGAAAMAFCIGVAAFTEWVRSRTKKD